MRKLWSGSTAPGGYEVEFTAADGDTVAVVTLAEGDIRPRRRREILHIREVASTPPSNDSSAKINKRRLDTGLLMTWPPSATR
ncbi:MAG: DUF4926 domain-containing protein [Jiangellaceae bacterium]